MWCYIPFILFIITYFYKNFNNYIVKKTSSSSTTCKALKMDINTNYRRSFLQKSSFRLNLRHENLQKIQFPKFMSQAFSKFFMLVLKWFFQLNFSSFSTSKSTFLVHDLNFIHHTMIFSRVTEKISYFNLK